MKKQYIKLSLIPLVISPLLVGCGGSSTTASIGTGTYVDSAVEGVTYSCGTQSGVTDKNGTFHFEKVKIVLLNWVNLLYVMSLLMI